MGLKDPWPYHKRLYNKKLRENDEEVILSVSSSMIVFLLILFWSEMYDRCVFLNTIHSITYKKKKKMVFKYHRVFGTRKEMDYIISSSRHYKIMPCVVLFCKISVIICYCTFVRSLKVIIVRLLCLLNPTLLLFVIKFWNNSQW